MCGFHCCVFFALFLTFVRILSIDRARSFSPVKELYITAMGREDGFIPQGLQALRGQAACSRAPNAAVLCCTPHAISRSRSAPPSTIKISPHSGWMVGKPEVEPKRFPFDTNPRARCKLARFYAFSLLEIAPRRFDTQNWVLGQGKSSKLLVLGPTRAYEERERRIATRLLPLLGHSFTAKTT